MQKRIHTRTWSSGQNFCLLVYNIIYMYCINSFCIFVYKMLPSIYTQGSWHTGMNWRPILNGHSEVAKVYTSSYIHVYSYSITPHSLLPIPPCLQKHRHTNLSVTLHIAHPFISCVDVTKPHTEKSVYSVLPSLSPSQSHNLPEIQPKKVTEQPQGRSLQIQWMRQWWWAGQWAAAVVPPEREPSDSASCCSVSHTSLLHRQHCTLLRITCWNSCLHVFTLAKLKY